ncbi:MAG TPA: hypothetical protein DCE14_02060 [Kosmotogaceae bacterium]|nr:MAG: Uncharacterized protein XE05_0846 [Thermotogales bacterium 46_20]HAA85117.1 hypothetical protein [Kosmotogaceae bacterium]
MSTRDKVNEYLDEGLPGGDLSETDRKDLKRYLTALALFRERTNYKPSKDLKDCVLKKIRRANLLPYRLGVLAVACVLMLVVSFDFFSSNVIEIRSRDITPDPFEQLLMLQRSSGPLVYSFTPEVAEVADETVSSFSIEDRLLRSVEFLRDDIKAGADLAVVSSTY